MENINLQAEKREVFGRKTSRLRQQGDIPAILYGHNFEPIPIQVGQKDFEKVYKETGESALVYIKIGDKEFPAIIHDIAVDPVDDHVIHADFYKVRLDEKITADVPLVFVGESPAVKDLGGILIKNVNQVKVEAFPQDLPHNIEVDVSRLVNFKDNILIKDLTVSDKVKIKENPEGILALIQEPISQEELEKQLETPAVAPEEVEVIKKEEKEEVAGEASEEQKETPVAAKLAK